MAVAFDAQGHIDTAASTTATSLSGTPITIGSGSNRAIGVCLAFGSAIGLPTSITVTCGGTSMAAVTNATSAAGAVSASVLWFALVNPTSGTPTIAASWTGGRSCVMGAVSATGVDQTGGTTSFAHGAGNVSVSSTTASVTVASAIGNMTVAAHADDGGVVINSTSATQDFIDMLGVGPGTAMHHTAGTASNVMTATLASTDDTANAGFDFVASAASVALPFNTYEYPKVWDIRQAPFDLSVQTNLNLFKNPIPFSQFDWPTTKRVRRSPFDLSVQTNLNLFKNPIPFNQFDWSKPNRVLKAPFDLSVQTNQNLFKNPIPILNVQGFQTSWGVADLPVPQQPYNQSLYAITVTVTLMGQIWT